MQALVRFPSVLCREPVPVAKSPTPSRPSSSAPSVLWVRILGKVLFGLMVSASYWRGWGGVGRELRVRQVRGEAGVWMHGQLQGWAGSEAS